VRVIHGHRRAFLTGGSGPVLLLIHGIGDSAGTWSEVIDPLSRHFTVVAPDLLGHGRSDKPRADYSVAAYANAMRDLLEVLGIDRVTVVGHSLGGGVAAQFAYQFPDRCERLVLVSSGGVGRSVHPVLRMAALPGAELVVPALGLAPVRRAMGLGVQTARRLGLVPSDDLDGIVGVLDRLPGPGAAQAVVRTLRGAVDWRGQCITMRDRAYLAEGLPVMVVWGRLDTIIPVGHALAAHRSMVGSRLEVFDDAGHFPHRSSPGRFVDLVVDFVATTEPATHDVEVWRRRLRAGAGTGAAAGVATRATAGVPADR
jgi:pimeloyl-ACP methyl ester carboxylesterase